MQTGLLHSGFSNSGQRGSEEPQFGIRILFHALFTTSPFSLFQTSHTEAKTWRGWSRAGCKSLASAAIPGALPSMESARVDNCCGEISGSFSSAMGSLRNQVTYLGQNLTCLLTVSQKFPLLAQLGLPCDGTLAEFYRHVTDCGINVTDCGIQVQKDPVKETSEKASCPACLMVRSLCHPLELKAVWAGCRVVLTSSPHIKLPRNR